MTYSTYLTGNGRETQNAAFGETQIAFYVKCRMTSGTGAFSKFIISYGHIPLSEKDPKTSESPN